MRKQMADFCAQCAQTPGINTDARLGDARQLRLRNETVERESANEEYADNKDFSLEYSNISPYAMIEILNLNEAQQDRFDKAYEVTRRVLMGLKLLAEEDRELLLELDELERGFPCMTLRHMYDIVRFCADTVAKEEADTYLGTREFHDKRAKIAQIIKEAKLPTDARSWRKVQGSLSRLKRSGGGVDDGLWNRLPNLAPGQAIVSAASMFRPLLVAVAPTPSKLRMVESLILL